MDLITFADSDCAKLLSSGEDSSDEDVQRPRGTQQGKHESASILIESAPLAGSGLLPCSDYSHDDRAPHQFELPVDELQGNNCKSQAELRGLSPVTIAQVEHFCTLQEWDKTLLSSFASV
jgi:hypothetical protein